MKVSELTNSQIADFIHVDETDSMLTPMKEAAIAYVKNFTGMSDAEIDEIQEMWIAVACLISDMYDNRAMNVKEEGVNQTAQSILYMHSKNYL